MLSLLSMAVLLLRVISFAQKDRGRCGGALARVARRVIAGVDCGFGTFVGWEWVTEDVMWAKLATLRAGADIASKRLWDRKAA
jgi:hypothetical protein